MSFWEGIEQMHDHTVDVKRKKKAGELRGMQLALRNVLNVSNESVPFEEGDLERDGAWSVDDGTVVRGAVSYGRSAKTKDYAVPQHERMDYHHDAGRSAKFLERAFSTTRDQNLELIAEQVRREMEG